MIKYPLKPCEDLEKSLEQMPSGLPPILPRLSGVMVLLLNILYIPSSEILSLCPFQSFVTCTFGIDKVGYVMICFGVGDSLFSYLLGKLTKYTGRVPIFISGAVLHLAIYIVLLSWKADRDMLWMAFLMAALWGYTDAVWQTQINGMVNAFLSKSVNRNKSESVF